MSFIAPILPFLAMAGGGVSGISSILGGFAQSSAMKSQAEAARYNQAVALQNAEAVRKAGDYEREKLQRKQAQLRGTVEANVGASGVEMAGTPLDVMAENAYWAEKDLIAQKYNTETQAGRFQSQAANYGFEADRNESMSGLPILQGFMGAGSTLLGTAYKVYGPQGSSKRETF